MVGVPVSACQRHWEAVVMTTSSMAGGDRIVLPTVVKSHTTYSGNYEQTISYVNICLDNRTLSIVFTILKMYIALHSVAIGIHVCFISSFMKINLINLTY